MKKIIFTISFSILTIFIITTMLTSCAILDKYVVKKEKYDEIKNEYNKIQEQYKNETEENQKLQSENQKLKDDVEQQVKEINDLKDKLEFKSDLNNYVTKEEYDRLYSDYLEEQKNKEDLEKKIDSLKKEPEKLKEFLNSLNKLLKNVYIGSSDPTEIQYTFTAFSIEYKGKYYLITAGHCVNDNFGKEGKFKFQANFGNEWIYPELLAYKAEFWNLDDYGIFFSDKINSGLKVGSERTEDTYALGSVEKELNIFRNLKTSSQRGESGSPVINENGDVVGILVVAGLKYTPIQLVIDKIDSLEAEDNS
jgi:cell division protein FtsB